VHRSRGGGHRLCWYHQRGDRYGAGMKPGTNGSSLDESGMAFLPQGLIIAIGLSGICYWPRGRCTRPRFFQLWLWCACASIDRDIPQLRVLHHQVRFARTPGHCHAASVDSLARFRPTRNDCAHSTDRHRAAHTGIVTIIPSRVFPPPVVVVPPARVASPVLVTAPPSVRGQSSPKFPGSYAL
jgi:hypothetical protein